MQWRMVGETNGGAASKDRNRAVGCDLANTKEGVLKFFHLSFDYLNYLGI